MVRVTILPTCTSLQGAKNLVLHDHEETWNNSDFLKKHFTAKKCIFLVWIEAISNKILLTSPQKTNSVGESKKLITKFEKDLSA